MLSYALDVWRMSWITAASKAQSGLLAVPEDTSLQKGSEVGVFIKFSSHWQAACFSFYLALCSNAMVRRPPDSPSSQYPTTTTTTTPRNTHTFYFWPVSEVITGRLLDAFMKYSNSSMSYCALIMPHKDERKGGADVQTENNNERTPYLLGCGQDVALCFSPLWPPSCVL